MRGPAAFAMTIGAAFAAGCTLLVSFDAPNDVAEAGTETDSGPVTPGDAQAPSDSAVVATPTDAADARSDFPPECKGPPPILGFCNPAGMVCGSRITDYPADKVNDLLLCEGDAIKVFTCRARCPIGCVTIDGFDDQCDPCKGRADATYCGRDVGWTQRNENVAVRCKAGKFESTTGCAGKKCQSGSGCL